MASPSRKIRNIRKKVRKAKVKRKASSLKKKSKKRKKQKRREEGKELVKASLSPLTSPVANKAAAIKQEAKDTRKEFGLLASETGARRAVDSVSSGVGSFADSASGFEGNFGDLSNKTGNVFNENQMAFSNFEQGLEGNSFDVNVNDGSMDSDFGGNLESKMDLDSDFDKKFGRLD